MSLAACSVYVSPEEYNKMGLFQEWTSGHTSAFSALLGPTVDTRLRQFMELDFTQFLRESGLCVLTAAERSLTMVSLPLVAHACPSRG